LVPSPLAPSAARPPLGPVASLASRGLLLVGARFPGFGDGLLLFLLGRLGIGPVSGHRLLVPWIASAGAVGNVLSLVAEGVLQLVVRPSLQVLHRRRLAV